jgi:hypothetical protein
VVVAMIASACAGVRPQVPATFRCKEFVEARRARKLILFVPFALSNVLDRTFEIVLPFAISAKGRPTQSSIHVSRLG